jgi:hypothetical protein
MEAVLLNVMLSTVTFWSTTGGMRVVVAKVTASPTVAARSRLQLFGVDQLLSVPPPVQLMAAP